MKAYDDFLIALTVMLPIYRGTHMGDVNIIDMMINQLNIKPDVIGARCLLSPERVEAIAENKWPFPMCKMFNLLLLLEEKLLEFPKISEDQAREIEQLANRLNMYIGSCKEYFSDDYPDRTYKLREKRYNIYSIPMYIDDQSIQEMDPADIYEIEMRELSMEDLMIHISYASFQKTKHAIDNYLIRRLEYQYNCFQEE